MLRSILMISLLAAGCVHDDVDLGDFQLDCDPEEAGACPDEGDGGGGDGDEVGEGEGEEDAGDGGGDGDAGPGEGGDGGEGEGEAGDDGEGGDDEGDDGGGDGGDDGDHGGEDGGDGCWDTGCPDGEACNDEGECVVMGANLCDEPLQCIRSCDPGDGEEGGGDDGKECGIRCVQNLEFDPRQRVTAMLACIEELGSDEWLVEQLCGAEGWSCHEGTEPEDLTCLGGIFCHFGCQGDSDCHERCDEHMDEVAPEAFVGWRDCVADSCVPGQPCDPSPCDGLLDECRRKGLQDRCDEWCRDELFACDGGVVGKCLRICEMEPHQVSAALQCVVSHELDENCDGNRVEGCWEEGRQAPPPDHGDGPGPGPGPGEMGFERALYEPFEGGPSEGWSELSGQWDLNDGATVTECPGCPETPAILQLERDVPTQFGFAQLSFRATLPLAGEPAAVWASLHKPLRAPEREDGLARFIGVRLSMAANGLAAWSRSQAEPTDRWRPRVERGVPYDVRITCFGDFGYDLGVFPPGVAVRPLSSRWVDDPCELPDDGAQARILLGGTDGAVIDEVRLELLACQPDAIALEERTGECGRVGSWPFDRHHNEVMRDWAPAEDAPAGYDIVEHEGRMGVFIRGDAGALAYHRPPGADSAHWAVDMWVMPHEEPDDLEGVQPRPLFTDHLVSDSQVPTGRRIFLTPENRVVCDLFGLGEGRGQMSAQSDDRIPWEGWTRVGCSWDGEELAVYAGGETNRSADGPVEYAPSRDLVRLGGPVPDSPWDTFRGWISDVRLHATGKHEAYYAE